VVVGTKQLKFGKFRVDKIKYNSDFAVGEVEPPNIRDQVEPGH
jgi:hypothetical protein